MNIQPTNQKPEFIREDISEYVAQLQLHMALQARNLVPQLNSADINSSRQKLLQESQAVLEKLASRHCL